MGGTVLSNTGTPLFGGVTPPNGFMVQINNPNTTLTCWVNDNGQAGGNPPSGFTIGGTIGNYPSSGPAPVLFVTPPGYRPMGPVTVGCTGPTYVEVRAW
jgi:hypothetical protein